MSAQGSIAGGDFIHYFATLALSDVPPRIQAEARRLLADQLACVVAARATEIGPVVEEGAQAIWPGGGAVATAYRLARLGDAMDFDDGAAGAHFGCGAVAAALALAPTAGADGAELLTAIIAGFEAGGRIHRATGSYFNRIDGVDRFLPVWGISTPIVYAAAMAATRLLRLPAQTALQALSLAGAFAPIPVGAKWSAMIDLPDTKYCDTGWAAAAGVSGVLLAQTGTTGLTNLLEPDGGLFTMLSASNAAPDELALALGEDWGLSGIRYKEWPCCGMLFGALWAARAIVAEHPGDIGAVEVWVPENTALPRFTNPAPRTFASRQFSLPHAMAMLLFGVESGPLWLDPGIAAQVAITALRERVQVHALTPEHREAGIAAEVVIEIDGVVRRAQTSVAALSLPREPCDDAGIADKLHRMVGGPEAACLWELVAAMPSATPAAEVLKILQETRPR
ncbi:MmgE/PrpD family protein [Limoniibacter endophyticus]|uniref:2-methylcitrate dehydratase PrpD n=1 Tax=Limoniibacter endophyticus TaxID=1565040 RepID=A0A8J3DJQ1_9HYPH|nr:MmgE/PrpD family protein [Limoniibacter endophyticus]GHC78891.1 hypothetical protein GCM10010136_30980 [Limoniibacter endophyticus]